MLEETLNKKKILYQYFTLKKNYNMAYKLAYDIALHDFTNETVTSQESLLTYTDRSLYLNYAI